MNEKRGERGRAKTITIPRPPESPSSFGFSIGFRSSFSSRPFFPFPSLLFKIRPWLNDRVNKPGVFPLHPSSSSSLFFFSKKKIPSCQRDHMEAKAENLLSTPPTHPPTCSENLRLLRVSLLELYGPSCLRFMYLSVRPDLNLNLKQNFTLLRFLSPFLSLLLSLFFFLSFYASKRIMMRKNSSSSFFHFFWNFFFFSFW